MNHLHDAVQIDLKKLLRNPPLVKMPKIRDLVNANPLLGALPSTVRDTLVGSTKETVKLCGTILYREGSKPNGIWLISNGVVKWTSETLRNKHLLHPTFTHGSTLGLYEVLVGKSYVCDIVTDSVVLCFFIEAEKILAAVRSSPAVEDFFWRESAIMLSKLLLPHPFDNLTMQDMRVLVSERSVMNVYISGESLELPQHSVGILLEGYLRAQGLEEYLASPAALLHSYGVQKLKKSEMSGEEIGSFSHQSASYLVETRARVITIDVAGFEAHRGLQRRPSSLITVDHPSGHITREYGNLMSWPEHYFQARRHRSDPETTKEQEKNLSARAMQLSIFGSTVNSGSWHARNSPRRGKRKQSPHSNSYPTVPSNHNRKLVSVKSESSSYGMMQKKKREGAEDRRRAPQPVIMKENQVRDYSSDESGGEGEELIVRIDSPSTLSFGHAS